MSMTKETTSIFIDQARFMALGNQYARGVAPRKQIALYAALVDEESNEFLKAFFQDADDIESIKEAIDIIVVASGFLVSLLGADDAQRAWDAVFASNLAKVQGVMEKREDGKILKNDEYKEVAKKTLMKELNCIYDAR